MAITTPSYLLSGFTYPPTSYSTAYGGKPTLPSPTGTARTALTGNLANMSNIYNLAKGINAASAAGAREQLVSNLPNYAEMTRQSSQNILSELSGQLPQDVYNQIAQRAAERGVASGAPMSANANAALLAALGKTSIDLTQMGEQNLTGAVARTPRGPIFDPSTMLVTPEQQQQAEVAQAVYAAAPDPAAAARAQRSAARAGLRAGMRTGGGGGGGTSWAGSFAPRSGFSSGVPLFQSEPTPTFIFGAAGGYTPEATDPYRNWGAMTDFGNLNSTMDWGGAPANYEAQPDEWAGYTLNDYFGTYPEFEIPGESAPAYDYGQDVMSWGLYE